MQGFFISVLGWVRSVNGIPAFMQDPSFSIPRCQVRFFSGVQVPVTKQGSSVFILDYVLESGLGSSAKYLLSRKTQCPPAYAVGPKGLVKRSTVLFCCVSLASPPDFLTCFLDPRPGFWLLIFSTLAKIELSRLCLDT